MASGKAKLIADLKAEKVRLKTQLNEAKKQYNAYDLRAKQNVSPTGQVEGWGRSQNTRFLLASKNRYHRELWNHAYRSVARRYHRADMLLRRLTGKAKPKKLKKPVEEVDLNLGGLS